jgi:hypothetical protein
MSVVKLNQSHADAVKNLFRNKKYMGLPLSEFTQNPNAFNNRLYEIFCNNYLSGITKNFHAYGYIQDDQVESLISFYESTDEPAWYYTVYRSNGNNKFLKEVLDAVIQHNEIQGRLKFYTLTNVAHTKFLRKFHWSKFNNERYGYFDEFVVPEKHRCFYTNHWELLFKRFLIPADSIVRCNYLKQEYRLVLPVGGGI